MASANPWEQASQALELALYPPLTSAFWTQLDLLRWIYGLGVLLGVAGTLIRIQRNNIWLFRVEKGREGEWISLRNLPRRALTCLSLQGAGSFLRRQSCLCSLRRSSVAVRCCAFLPTRADADPPQQ